MAYDYATFVQTLANEMVTEQTNPEFLIVLPTIIDDAEQRIYRKLDLLATVVTDQTGILTPDQRMFDLPVASGRFVTLTQVNVFTPAGSTTTRNPMAIVSRGYLDAAWPSDTSVGTSVPNVYAMHTDQQIVVGPPPSDAFTMELVGTIRPEPLSATNTETFLTLYLPDLFFAAAMVRAAGYQKNFGAQADDKQMAGSWEALYQERLASADAEEMRKRWQGTSWTTPAPGPRS